MDESKYSVIVFCGPPGSMKTYLASRVAARLGFAYLPTSCFGAVSTRSGPDFERQRQRRYQRLESAAHEMCRLGLRVVIDGGFSAKPRQSLLARFPRAAIVARCRTIDDAVTRARLAVRAMDRLDCESRSASEVLQIGPSDATPDSWLPDDGVPWLEITTDTGALHWVRDPGDALGGRLVELVRDELIGFGRLAAQRSVVLDAFTRLADGYDTATAWRLDSDLLATLRRAPVRPAAEVLDLGCGTGLVGAWYHEQGHRVIGLDLSPTMLSLGRQRMQLGVIGDAHSAPFLDHTFDVVVVRQLLHYVDPEAVLAEVARVLTPGGSFGLCSLVAPRGGRAWWKRFKSLTHPLARHVFDEARILELVTAAGLRPVGREITTLRRAESYDQLSLRAPVPSHGWRHCLSDLARQAEVGGLPGVLSVDVDSYTLNQRWLTVWAVKPHSARGVTRSGPEWRPDSGSTDGSALPPSE